MWEINGFSKCGKLMDAVSVRNGCSVNIGVVLIQNVRNIWQDTIGFRSEHSSFVAEK